MNPRRLTPSMSLLIAFDAAARRLSFTEAASDLVLTQSAISRQVQALEELLGVPLFRRANRKLTLTAIGSVYHREIDVALKRVRSASLQAIASQTGRGSLDLAALPTFASKWLMPRLSDFYEKHTGIQINLHSRIGHFDLEHSGIDAVIGVSEAPWPGVLSYKICDETLLPIMSPTTAKSMPIKAPSDVFCHLLLRVAASPDAWGSWFEEQSLDNRSMNMGPQFELTSHLIEAVSSGLGIGLVPSFLIEGDLRAGSVKIAIDRPLRTGRSYYLILPAGDPPLPQSVVFRDWILAIAKDFFANNT